MILVLNRFVPSQKRMMLSPVKIAREKTHTASFLQRLRTQEGGLFLEAAAVEDAVAVLEDPAVPADIN